MRNIPTRKIANCAETGIMLRTLTPGTAAKDSTELHRDDYYAFCFLRRGEVRINVDFREARITSPSIACMMPGQVHQFIGMRDAEGFVMFIDGVLIGEENRTLMQRFAFSLRPLTIDEQRGAELYALFPMLQRRLHSPNAQDFARAIVGIFTDVIGENDNQMSQNKRHRELLIRFSELLDHHITECRQPSFYADHLYITTGYLNEILTSTIGLSTSHYIRREIILHMKRELAYSNDTVQEIAHRLGFEDLAYFSRLFTKQVGISPSLFRSKYHV